jgi:hypothetical protein
LVWILAAGVIVNIKEAFSVGGRRVLRKKESNIKVAFRLRGRKDFYRKTYDDDYRTNPPACGPS